MLFQVGFLLFLLQKCWSGTIQAEVIFDEYVELNGKVSKNVKKTYEFEEKPLGEGNFGTVFLGVEELTRLKIAFKTMDPQFKKLFDKELLVIKTLGASGNPATLKKSEARKNGFPCVLGHGTLSVDQSEVLFIAMECLSGELRDLLEDNFNDEEWAGYGAQMIKSIRYMHSKGVVHGDVKPENFLGLKTDESIEVFLVDFGLSCTTRLLRKKVPGTILHLSLREHEAAKKTGLQLAISHESDIHSFAISFIYLKFPKLPWYDLAEQAMEQSKLATDAPDQHSKNIASQEYHILMDKIIDAKKKFPVTLNTDKQYDTIRAVLKELIIRTYSFQISSGRKYSEELGKLADAWAGMPKTVLDEELNKLEVVATITHRSTKDEDFYAESCIRNAISAYREKHLNSKLNLFDVEAGVIADESAAMPSKLNNLLRITETKNQFISNITKGEISQASSPYCVLFFIIQEPKYKWAETPMNALLANFYNTNIPPALENWTVDCNRDMRNVFALPNLKDGAVKTVHKGQCVKVAIAFRNPNAVYHG